MSHNPTIDRPAADSPMTCLRCRHCVLKPETDLSLAMKPAPNGLTIANLDAVIPIYCEKTRKMRPAVIFEACRIADGRYHAHCYTVASDKTGSSPEGDRCKFLSAPERLFLRLHWPQGDLDALRRATGRLPRALTKLARRYQLPPRSDLAKLEAIRKVTADARSRVTGARFTSGQREYIENCYRTDHWPQKGGEANPDIKRRNAALREEITDRVGELGPSFTWEQIRRHQQGMRPGAQRWRRQWDNENRRQGKWGGKVVSA